MGKAAPPGWPLGFSPLCGSFLGRVAMETDEVGSAASGLPGNSCNNTRVAYMIPVRGTLGQPPRLSGHCLYLSECSGAIHCLSDPKFCQLCKMSPPAQFLWGKGDCSSWLLLESAHLGFLPPLPFPLENLPDEADRDKYELLCPDNTRKPVDAFKECHLARVPSHAVVARSVDGREDLIWRLLHRAQVPPPPPQSSWLTWIR